MKKCKHKWTCIEIEGRFKPNKIRRAYLYCKKCLETTTIDWDDDK